MGILKRLKNTAREALRFASNSATPSLDALLQLELSKELARLQAEMRTSMPENPAAYGFKV